MLMLFGCKSDTPVQANEDSGSVASLQKPSWSFSFVKSGGYVICTWNKVGGAKYYEIDSKESSDYMYTELVTVTAVHGQKNYADTINVSGWTSGTYYFKLAAIGHHYTVITSVGSEAITIP